MKPEIVESFTVKANCPDCDGAVSIFNYLKPNSGEFGTLIIGEVHQYGSTTYSRIVYKLLSCSGCSRGAIAKFHVNDQIKTLETFYPRALETASLPEGVPENILNEYREAELCSSFEAWRAASALIRSTLEKTLKENGYNSGTLEKKIDDAADDGIITDARKRKAHSDIRVLGNEIVHDEWREVDESEVSTALRYASRILEDFYDDRESVLEILTKKKRLKQLKEVS